MPDPQTMIILFSINAGMLTSDQPPLVSSTNDDPPKVEQKKDLLKGENNEAI